MTIFFRASGDYQDAPLLSAIIDNTFDDDNEKSGGENIGQELGDVITLVIGGYHTTGYGLTWVLYYLTVYPEVGRSSMFYLKSCWFLRPKKFTLKPSVILDSR